MVDSRQKGARAELALAKKLTEDTKLSWKRIPSSGALHQDHGLKGDVYIPGQDNTYCVECKHYKDSQLTSKVLTDKKPQLIEWWGQTLREAKQVNKEPMLFFKHDRSKWFVMMRMDYVSDQDRCIILYPERAVIYSYETWLSNVLQYIKWIK